MNHCERCGHPLSSHDADGVCLCAVQFGNGRCTCDNYLRAVVSLPKMLAAVLYTGPGRDASGSFYSAAQARLVARYADALLDTLEPTGTITGGELLEGWCDARATDERRSYSISRDQSGQCSVQVVVVRGSVGHDHAWQWSHASNGTNALRDAAAKAIMKAGQDGFGS